MPDNPGSVDGAIRYKHQTFSMGVTIDKKLLKENPITLHFVRSMAARKGWQTRRMRQQIKKYGYCE